MIINNNMQAMNTHRQLFNTTGMGAKSMEKLSSGFRINRAGDDAAGLSISEKMRAQIRGLNQASRNSQDGISLIQTAEGALNETHSILQRMRVLAVQAATDTNTDKDRDEIQKEINQLTSEINRIGNTTEFNTRALLNGDLSENFVVSEAVTTGPTTVEVTKAIGETIQIGEEPITWTAGSEAEFDIQISGPADNGFNWANIDTDTPNNLIITRDGSDFTVSYTGTDGEATANSLTIAADQVAFDPASGTYSYDNQGIEFSFTAEDVADWADGGSVTIDLNTVAGAGNDVTANPISTVAEKIPLVTTGTAAVPGVATMSDIVIADSDANLAGVDNLTIEWQETATSGTFTVTQLAGTDTISTTTFSLAAGDTLNFNQDGIQFTFTATAGDDANDTNIQGAFAIETKTTDVITAGVVTDPEVVEDRSLTFQVGANENQSLSLGVEDVRSKALGLSSDATGAGFTADAVVTNDTGAEYGLNISNREDASKAITIIQNAIETVSGERSKLGAVQNRLEYTIRNLDTSAENLQASESRIRDVDMAKEMMEFTKQNILQQAATAMLAQANQAPQGVLQLLR